MSNSKPVWHDIFRRVTLKPDNITLTAETYEDTLNIVRGPGVNFGDQTDTGTDTFEINVDYKLKIPLSTTTIRLEDVNNNITDIELAAGRGVVINRTGSNKLEFQAYGVTETDTLQTVLTRGNISDKDMYVNNLTVGRIESDYPPDGFTSITTTSPTPLIGVGTLSEPVKFSTTTVASTVADATITINLTGPSIGTFGYGVDFQSTEPLTSGTISLERQNPITLVWEYLEQETGNQAYTPLVFQNYYSELHNGTVNYRITFAWVGNIDSVSYRVNFFFESGGIVSRAQLRTDTELKTVTINDLEFFQNNIRSINSSSDIVLQPAGSGLVYIDTDQALRIPVGDINVRPAGIVGQIRFNTSTNQYEGFNGTAWSSLGGVRDVDGNTFIAPELTTGSNDNTLWFFNDGVLSASLTKDRFDVVKITVDDISINSNIIETTTTGSNLNLQASGLGYVSFTDTNSIKIPVGNTEQRGLSTPGQIRFNTDLNQFEGYNGIAWSSLGSDVAGNRIYVSDVKGSDSNDGFTSPVATIKRALEIAGGLATPIFDPGATAYDARDLLEANKLFIQSEVIAYINDQVLNNIPPYASGFVYDQALCARDVGIILDAILGDIIFNTNYQTRVAGLSYIRSYASTVTSSQKAQTIAGLSKARDLALGLITNVSMKSLITANMDIVIDIINAVSESAAPALAFSNPLNTSNGVLNASAILQANRSFIIDELIAYIDANLNPGTIPGYNETVCRRDTGYIVDALTFDILYGGNTATVIAANSYYTFSTNIVQSEKPEFASTFNYLKSIIGYIVQADNTSWTKLTLSSQNVSLPAGSAGAASTASILIQYVMDIVENGSSAAPVETKPTYSNGVNYVSRNIYRETILNEIGTIKNDTIAYLNDVYSDGLIYNQAFCRRDVGYIIEKVYEDLLTGTNENSIFAGVRYFAGTATLVVTTQKEETLDAINYAKSLALSVLNNSPPSQIYQAEVTQTINLSKTPSNDNKTTVSDLFDTIISIIQTGESPEAFNPFLSKYHTRDLLRANKEFIKAEVTGYVAYMVANGLPPYSIGFTYSEETCSRDIGYIIEAAAFDTLFGGNANSRFCGLRHYAPTASLVISGQKVETIDAINYAKSLALLILDNTTPGTIYQSVYSQVFDLTKVPSASDKTSVSNSFDIVTNIIDNGVGAAPALVEPNIRNPNLAIFVSSGNYIENNPLVMPDNVTIVGDDLRSVIIRPKNSNKDLFRVRNNNYITGVTFRDKLLDGVPYETFRYAVSFDNLEDSDVDRTAYTGLPNLKPLITTSPYVQNCSLISFLGASGAEIDGDLVITPNTPANQIEAENPVLGPAPEQGKSMVANAFTILTFGGNAWRVLNSAYAQIVSCFVIFAEQGDLTQNGGYLSVTNSATNFGLFALRSSGYTQTAFDYDKGYISSNGINGAFQTIKVVGFQRAPLENYVIKIIDANTDIDITDSFNSNSTLGKTASFTASVSTVGGNTITFPSPHGFVSGERVTYFKNSNREIVGLFNELTYYVSVGSFTQISLFHDSDLTIPVRSLDASPTSGTHYFRSGYEEFYVGDIIVQHNSYQDITIPAGSYNIVIGSVITGMNGTSAISAIITDYDQTSHVLTLSIEQVQIGQNLVRHYFAIGSTIDAGVIDVGAVTVLDVSNRADLWTSEFEARSTLGRTVQGIASASNQKIQLHRPSVCNSSAHTWEFCGAGTDYNALPQNGGRTIQEFEQYQDLPGRVYTSGTNEIGDFKIGTDITAFNRTGNIVFNNKVSIGQLDSLSFSLSGGVKITAISTDIELGDSEIGGAQDSRLTTQLAQRTFLNNRLGSFINKSVSTDSVPGAVVQLNSSGLINPSLVPSKGLFNSFTVNTHNGRLVLYENIPVVNLGAGDIVVEKYNQNVLTLTGSITLVAGETITQTGSGATGVVKVSGSSNTLYLIEPLTGTFNTVGQLTGSVSGALGASSVPAVVAGVTEQTDNWFLSNGLVSQYLILDASVSPTFTTLISNATKITGAVSGAVVIPTQYRSGVMTSLNVAAILPGGSGYLTPGTYSNVSITNISGTGTNAKANVTVDITGKISGFTIYRGGTGYHAGDIVSVSDASVGGRSGGSAIQLTVITVENRLYVTLDTNTGLPFTASGINIDFIIDDNPSALPIVDQATISEKTLLATDVGVGGNVNYSQSTFVFGSAHGYTNGDPVIYDSNSNIAIGGLTNLNTYYVKYVSSVSIELYTTFDLLPANKVDFTGSSTGTHKLRIEVVNTNSNRIYYEAHGLTSGSAVKYTSASAPGGIVSGQYFFIGGVTTNSFTLHANRGNALSSVNGLIVASVEITSTGSGSASLQKQNVIVNSVVNTSGQYVTSWSSLSNTTISAENIVSGVVNPSRLGSGTANTDTFLRGDSSWQYAVAGIKNTISTDPITLTGNHYTSGSDEIYHGIVDIRIEKATQGFPIAATGNETLGIAKYAFDHFVVDTAGLVTTKGSAVGGVIDASTLGTHPGSFYLNPENMNRNVPIEKGGTNIASYDQGDILYAATSLGNGTYSQSLSRLPIGATNTVLISGGTAPAWSTSLNLAGSLTVGTTLTVTGNLVVNGTTTTVNSTTVSVDDINITLGDTASPTDALADGGGITLKGTTDKTITWVNSTGRWTFNQPIEGTSIQNTPIGSSTRAPGAFTTLGANNTVSINTTTNNQSYTTTGAGIITISSGTTGTIDNMQIGNTTRASGKFTTIDANNTVTLSPGTGTVTINPTSTGSIDNMNIGASTRGTGAFTTLGANNTVSINTTTNNQSYTTTGAGVITISSGTTGTIDNMQIGNTTRAAGKFTTIDANNTVTLSPGTSTVTINPTNVGNINNMNIGASTRGTGAFTTLDANSTIGLSPANANVTINPTGTGSVSINPATVGSIDNMNIGASTRGTGAFTTLAANSTVTFSATTQNIDIGTSQTTGTVTLGAALQTGIITVGQSTKAQTINIGTGATENTLIKTINIGTNGVTGSTTNITIGSSIAGTTTISSPTTELSGNLNIATGKTYKINSVDVLSSNTLGANVITSSLTTVATITTGIWRGTIVEPAYGGTGVNNGIKTITLGGNLTTSGAFSTTLTVSAATSVTLPTSGTLQNDSDMYRTVTTLRSNRNISGGGTITIDASGYITWSQRFIIMANGRGSNFSTNGYFDITVPGTGVTITGVGGASNVTTTSAGIPLASWQALYYILPIGSSSTSVDANFRVVSYTADLDIPNTWVLICIRNGDNGVFSFNNGVNLKVGENLAQATYDARNANFLQGYTLSTSNSANNIVLRDGSGNFSAGTITATLNGTANDISGQANSATITATSSNTANRIVLRDASGNFSAGTMTGIATEAYYADLAEKYVTDEEYEFGTVIVVGGVAEVTACTVENAHNVIGVISENPAFLMNRESEGQAIALKGRVKVKVIGNVLKGDRLIASDTKGHAIANNNKDKWHFAIALESGTGIVEAIIL